MKPFKTLVLGLCLIFLLNTSAYAATLGPFTTYAQLAEAIQSAQGGDTLLISGDLSGHGEAPLTSAVPLTIRTADGESATLRSVHLNHACITFSHISIEDSLHITGNSHVELGSGVHIQGAPGQSGVSFSGSGTLLVDPGCSVTGGEGSEGMIIRHDDGEFYAGIEGTVQGGSGYTGGAGLTISRLNQSATMMIGGKISGGSGKAIGGHALNLYELSDNAYITVAGTLEGGSGVVGGDGIQLVAASGNVSVGIRGSVCGGQGEDFGGDAVILMNLGGASSVNLTGTFTGGNVTRSGAQPGVSLLVVGNTSASNTNVGDAILQDGRELIDLTPEPEMTPYPDVTPLPEITASAGEIGTLVPPSPFPSATPTVVPSPTPSAAPTATPTVVPSPTPSAAPTATPTVAPSPTPSAAPTATPTVVPSPTPSAAPTATPTVVPSPTPSDVPTATPTVVPSPTPSAVPSLAPAQ